MSEARLLWWKRTLCSYLFQAPVPPEKCPNCKETCTFLDVTCYTPDCASSCGAGAAPGSSLAWKAASKIGGMGFHLPRV